MEATARGGVHDALMLADVLLAQQRLLHEHEQLRRHDAQADRLAHEAQVIPATNSLSDQDTIMPSAG
eukprot:COSAG05_NODE_1571_length_4520_cov_30.268491_2_plen_67_part_00